ncbi:group I intron-associated PD-(D/E)XK endonuclease [Haloarchaeobius litoreus]|uniref:Group I intron-associated PD-(D/E)XK endonuclease n=1 Tax=Haloarchaeobius litoreus TaxID=755306 RepID=A0ABD6DDE3_9EURY
MNPSRRGDETEAILLARLLECGCSVAVPFGDSDRYDLLVDDDGYLFRVQCKTGSWVNGTVRFKLYSPTVTDGERVDTGYTAAEVDAYAVYSPETEAAYWVPISETGTGEMRLRVEKPEPKAPRSRLNWASEYLLVERFG